VRGIPKLILTNATANLECLRTNACSRLDSLHSQIRKTDKEDHSWYSILNYFFRSVHSSQFPTKNQIEIKNIERSRRAVGFRSLRDKQSGRPSKSASRTIVADWAQMVEGGDRLSQDKVSGRKDNLTANLYVLLLPIIYFRFGRYIDQVPLPLVLLT
jgi:hypothetical protein